MQRARPAAAGFSLVELMVVVLIISVLGAISVPTVAKLKVQAHSTAVANDFRVFAAAFDSYAQENGSWPAEAAVGVVPTGMTGRINATAWQRQTPVGGKYNWDNNQMHFGQRYQAAITIAAATGAPLTLDVSQLYSLEKMIDGNVNSLNLTGNFQLSSSLNPLYLIQP